jgi:hypothetical protein
MARAWVWRSIGKKMIDDHEAYQQIGMYSVFGLDPEALRSAPPPLFQSY